MNRLVTIARFSHPAEAHAARNRLERAGIAAVVTDETAASMLSYVGSALGGARVQVEEQEARRAGEILLGIADDDPPEELKGYWRCRECQEIVDPGFEVCWSCLRSRPEVQDETFRPTLAVLADDADQDPSDRPLMFQLLQPSREARGEDDLNPYAPSGAIGGTATPQRLEIVPLTDPDELVLRAWRASVLGLFLLPPLLHVYSMYLLLRVSLGRGVMSPRANRRFYFAMIINLLVGLISGAIQWIRWPGVP